MEFEFRNNNSTQALPESLKNSKFARLIGQTHIEFLIRNDSSSYELESFLNNFPEHREVVKETAYQAVSNKKIAYYSGDVNIPMLAGLFFDNEHREQSFVKVFVIPRVDLRGE